MAASAQQVKELRDRTGAGVMDCKEALNAAGVPSAAATYAVADLTVSIAADSGYVDVQ